MANEFGIDDGVTYAVSEIARAIERKNMFQVDPAAHTFEPGRKNMGGNKRRRLRSKALQYAYGRYIGDKQAHIDSFEDELLNARVARQLYDLRTEAGLTQQQLADRVDTTASVICRLEDADYDGHSLSMLRRIAGALGKRVELRFVRN